MIYEQHNNLELEESSSYYLTILEIILISYNYHREN